MNGTWDSGRNHVLDGAYLLGVVRVVAGAYRWSLYHYAGDHGDKMIPAELTEYSRMPSRAKRDHTTAEAARDDCIAFVQAEEMRGWGI